MSSAKYYKAYKSIKTSTNKAKTAKNISQYTSSKIERSYNLIGDAIKVNNIGSIVSKLKKINSNRFSKLDSIVKKGDGLKTELYRKYEEEKAKEDREREERRRKEMRF